MRRGSGREEPRGLHLPNQMRAFLRPLSLIFRPRPAALAAVSLQTPAWIAAAIGFTLAAYVCGVWFLPMAVGISEPWPTYSAYLLDAASKFHPLPIFAVTFIGAMIASWRCLVLTVIIAVVNGPADRRIDRTGMLLIAPLCLALPMLVWMACAIMFWPDNLIEIGPRGGSAVPWWAKSRLAHIAASPWWLVAFLAADAVICVRADRRLNLAAKSLRPQCGKCDYDLTGLGDARTCPECGSPV